MRASTLAVALVAALIAQQAGARPAADGAGPAPAVRAHPAEPPRPEPAIATSLVPLRVSPIVHVQSSGFGWRDDPVNERRRKFHTGTDFRADRGTPVHAAGDGVVVFTGRLGGYGRTIHIDHGGGLVTRYAHLSKVEVTAGAHVTGSQRIGAVGSTGRTTGPHLHFEVRIEGRPVDPVLAMNVAELARTAPDLAAIAAVALTPAIQAQSLDAEDRTNQRRARRSQALW